MSDVAEVSPVIPEWTLGDRLAKSRRLAGFNQEAMAALIGISASAIAQWETDRNRPRGLVDVAERWADITGVDVSWLLGLRTGSFATPELEVLTNPDAVQATLPFDRDLALVR